jgi:hypothetical protein
MNGPKANVAIDGGFTAVSGKLVINEMVTIDVRQVVYEHPANGRRAKSLPGDLDVQDFLEPFQ